MVKTNIHTHTILSDGKSTPEEIIKVAINKGFIGVGFSDHGFTDFDLSYCITDIDKYKNKIQLLKDKYKSEIDIFLGVELDFFSSENTKDYDFVIGSLHYIYKSGRYYSVDESKDELRNCLDNEFSGNEIELVKAYYDKLVEGTIKTKPDVLGHFDVITKFGLINEESDKYRDTSKDALDAILDTDVIIEINTGAMSRGYKQYPYPKRELIERIFERDKKVMLGSDCHEASNMDFGFEFTKKLLYDVGFRSVIILTKNGFCESPIYEDYI